jgi:hypothetical protein
MTVKCLLDQCRALSPGRKKALSTWGKSTALIQEAIPVNIPIPHYAGVRMKAIFAGDFRRISG